MRLIFSLNMAKMGLVNFWQFGIISSLFITYQHGEKSMFCRVRAKGLDAVAAPIDDDEVLYC